ncbi:MAG: GDSL-type esterase/lipase family protein [Bacteroidales bacterium]
MSFPKRIKPEDTVFLGDSLTESFDLQKHFNRPDFINRGMSGNMTDHVLYRLEEITNAKPALIFLMIGINDIYQGSDLNQVVKNIEIIIDRIRNESPASLLIVQSMLPVNEERLLIDKYINTKVYEANNRLSVICKKKNLEFIDLHSDFLNNKGEMNNAYTYDGVHLTEKGYLLWADLLNQWMDKTTK